MSWLKRITGVQELTKEQRNTNIFLSNILTEISILNKQQKEQTKKPRTKN